MSKLKRFWFPVLTFIILIPSLTLHAYLGSFSRFMGDDYCSAFWANHFGVIRATWFWYITWSGRYSASALDSIFGILGPRVTPFVTPLVISLWLLSIGFMFFMIVHQKMDKLLSVGLLAMGVLFLTLNFTPQIQQSLYWGQGMRSVVPPLVLGMAYVGLFFAYKTRLQLHRRYRIVWYFLSFFLTFGMGGFGETYCVVQMVALGFSLVALSLLFHYPIKSPPISFLFFGFLGAVLSMATIYFAPGNAARAENFPLPLSMFDVLIISSRSMFGYLATLFSSTESITGTLGVFLLGAWVGYENASLTNVLRNLSFIFFGGVLLIFCCFPPSAYAMSDAPPDRTLIIATNILALLVVFSGYYFGSFVSSKTENWPHSVFFTVKLVIILCLGLSSFNVSKGMLGTRQKYIDFAIAWDRTNETLLLLKNEATDVVVPAVVDDWSGVLRMADNPRFYVNVCVSDYYGFKSIQARDDLPPTRLEGSEIGP